MSTSSTLCAQVRNCWLQGRERRSREGAALEIGTWQAGFLSQKRGSLQPHSTCDCKPTTCLQPDCNQCAGAPILSSLASASSPVEWVYNPFQFQSS